MKSLRREVRGLLLLVMVLLVTACGRRVVLDEESDEVGLQADLALNSEGLPRVAYFDKSNRLIKLALCVDARCSEFEIVVIDEEGAVGQYPSLVLTDQDMPVVSYYDMSKRALKVAMCQDAGCDAIERVILDETGKVGEYSSLRLNAQGAPVISYYDAENKTLKLAVCQDVACADVTLVVVDDTGKVGKYTSLALAEGDRPVISYYDEENEDLKIALCQDALCSAPTLKILAGGATEDGEYNALALDDADRPRVAYQHYDGDADPVVGAIKLAACEDAACTSVSHAEVDRKKGDRLGAYNSMVLDSDDRPIIGYWDPAGHAMRVALCRDATCDRSRTRRYVFDWGAQYASVGVNSDDKVYLSCYEVRPNKRRLLLFRPYVP